MPYLPQEIRDKVFQQAMPTEIKTLEDVERALRLRAAYFSVSVGHSETDLPSAHLQIDFKIGRQGQGSDATEVTTIQHFSLEVGDLLKVRIETIDLSSSTIAHYSRNDVGAKMANLAKYVEDYSTVAPQDIAFNCGSYDHYINQSMLRQIEEKTSFRFFEDEPLPPALDEQDSKMQEDLALAMEYSKEERKRW